MLKPGRYNIPKETWPAGYAMLAETFNIQAPLRSMSVISRGSVKGNKRRDGLITIHDNRDDPGNSVAHNIEFALRHESLDLLLLKKTFLAMDKSDLEKNVRSKPQSETRRRAWFLYEWLTGKSLDVPDLKTGNYVDAINPEKFHALADATNSLRHRVRDNLPGTPEFCALCRKDGAAFDSAGLSATAHEIVYSANPGVMQRAIAWMILADSRSSFAIEGEAPPTVRIQRWGRALASVTRTDHFSLTQESLDKLQTELLDDNRLVTPGLRQKGVFLGHHDRTNMPVPEFIGARSSDLPSLMRGLLEMNKKVGADKGIDPIIHAASLAFGFVYVHPYEDGNGRIHRLLVNHVLSARDVAPKGVVLPVSNAILDRIVDYGDVLRDHSAPLMDFIPWRPTNDGNIDVTGDTADLYRFPDVTKQAKFLAECVSTTIEHALPNEIAWISAYDASLKDIADLVDLPARDARILVNEIVRNDGTLSKNKRKKHFDQLSDALIGRIETAVMTNFDDVTPKKKNSDCEPV